GSGDVAVKAGAVTTTDPCGPVDPPNPSDGSTTVYYATSNNWSAYKRHYNVGTGAWTTAPGATMAPACAGWVSTTIPNKSGATVVAAFNNGSGTWDNNGGKDYALTGTSAAVKDGAVTTSNPCPEVDTKAPSVPTGVTAVVD